MTFIDNLGKLYDVDVPPFYKNWLENGRDSAKDVDFTRFVQLNTIGQRDALNSEVTKTLAQKVRARDS
jgi:hypothetical protein